MTFRHLSAGPLLALILCTMRSWGYIIPNLLTSQFVDSTPAWIPTGGEMASDGRDRLGAVASESSICSRIGTDALLVGGNAADSMVATVLCVGVIGMYHSGIGGGGFMLVRGSDGSHEFIDFRETAPAAASQDMFNDRGNLSIFSGLASAIPGELRGLAYLHDHYGSLPWELVVMPAVKVARDGFPVTEDLARYANVTTEYFGDFLIADPSWAQDFAPNGTLLRVGETITRRRYADTLETVAKQGPDAFYTGPIAQATIDAIQSRSGIMTMKDLEDYEVTIREPAEIDYRGYKIRSGGAPSSGGVLLEAMKIIEGFSNMGDLRALNLSTHLFDEAIRFAQGKRTELGDPAYVEGMDEFEADMLSESTIAEIRAKINPLHTLDVSDYDPSGFESKETPGTSAVVTSDASGLAISLTTTVNLLFGNQIMVPETGVILNNEMNDFSIPGRRDEFGYFPCPSNYIRPGKRPMSSITPVIVSHASNESLHFVVGAAGGSRILTATLQQLWHVLDHNMSAPEALEQPRFHDQLLPNRVEFEWTFDNGTTESMKERGHEVAWKRPFGWSAAQSVRVLENGTFEAAGEPRQLNSGGFAV